MTTKGLPKIYSCICGNTTDSDNPITVVDRTVGKPDGIVYIGTTFRVHCPACDEWGSFAYDRVNAITYWNLQMRVG